MAKTKIMDLHPGEHGIKDPHVNAVLFRDPKTGIAWVENYRAGIGHSCHPNIASSGSVAGMKRKGWWGKNDRTVRSHGFIHNIDLFVVSDELDQIACDHCNCGGNHGARKSAWGSGKKRHAGPHQHRAKTHKMHGWTHCVADGPCSGAAHGSVTYLDTCACGLVRETESNGRHTVRSSWYDPGQTSTHGGGKQRHAKSPMKLASEVATLLK